jgi:molecular chaperone DnaJ
MGTQTGTVFRLKGKGMPQLGDAVKGICFVSVSVITPTSLTREQRKILEQLAEVENKDLEDKGFSRQGPQHIWIAAVL